MRRASPVRSTDAAETRRRLSVAAPSTAAASDALTPASEQQAQEQGADWLPSPSSRGAAPCSWQRPLGRKRPAVSPLGRRPSREQAPVAASEGGEEAQSPEDRVLASLDLNRYLRPSRVSMRTGETDPGRQSVLESAISLAKQAMAEPDLEYGENQRHSFYESSMYPSAEFVHLMLYGK